MMRDAQGQDGAIAVLVAIVLVVMLGISALVVDGGNLYWERRQLQNAADASALALAAQCVEGVVDCEASTSVLAASVQPFADANADDGRHGLPPLMAHGPDPEICEPGTTVADNPLTGSSVVKVSTETVDATNDDSSFITNVFGGLLGIDTTTVTACATAAWGYAAGLATIPLVISLCEYNPDPDEGLPTETFPGPHPNSGATVEKILFHQGTGGDEDPCNAQAGMDTDGDGHLPAGFGWLVNDGSCEVVTTVVDGAEWVDKDPGANPECGQPELGPLVGTVVQLPVFADFCRPPHDAGCPSYNNRDKYRIHTYASFYLQGYKLGGGPATEGGVHGCSGSQRCIVGYFTTSTVGSGQIGGPPGGVIVVQLTG